MRACVQCSARSHTPAMRRFPESLPKVNILDASTPVVPIHPDEAANLTQRLPDVLEHGRMRRPEVTLGTRTHSFAAGADLAVEKQLSQLLAATGKLDLDACGGAALQQAQLQLSRLLVTISEKLCAVEGL